MKRAATPAFLLLMVLSFSTFLLAQSQRWTEEKANAWYQQQPWLVGANYIPASAINELEMWQAETFDPQQIDKELGWAESLGMNTMRVFLHDLLWQQDAEGFQQRIDQFLSDRREAPHPARCWCCSIRAGTRCPSWARSARRCRAFTTRDGCRVREPRRWKTRRSIRG